MENKVEYKTEGKPDASQLAKLMLLWEEKRRSLDELEAAIKDTVLQLGKTQTVGNVRASFFKPRNSYDYETPVQDLLDCPETSDEDHAKIRNTIHNCTTQVVDWRAVCKFRDIDPIVTPGEGPGSVSIKLLE